MSIDPSTVTAADLANPALDAHALHSIAQARPDLWPLIVEHPNTYLALNAWIGQQQAVAPTLAPQEPVVAAVSEVRGSESDAAAEIVAAETPAAETLAAGTLAYEPLPIPAEDAAATLAYPPLAQAAPTGYPQQGYPQGYPQPVPQGYPVAPGQPGVYPAMPGQYLPRKAKGSPLGPILMFVAALAFLVAGGLPAATSPRETVALVDLATPFAGAALAWFALLISSIVAWILRTRGALLTGAIFGFVCGAVFAFIGIGNAFAASVSGWKLDAGFFVLIAVGVLAIVGGVIALVNRPKTAYV